MGMACLQGVCQHWVSSDGNSYFIFGCLTFLGRWCSGPCKSLNCQSIQNSTIPFTILWLWHIAESESVLTLHSHAIQPHSWFLLPLDNLTISFPSTEKCTHSSWKAYKVYSSVFIGQIYDYNFGTSKMAQLIKVFASKPDLWAVMMEQKN